MVRSWVYDPHSGGMPIPQAVRARIRGRIIAHAAKNYAGKYDRIDVRFRGRFCYVDAYTEPYVSENYDPKLFNSDFRSAID